MKSTYSDYSTEELKRKIKSQQKSTYLHGVIVVLLFITGAYKTFEEGFSFFSLLPLFFVPMQVYMSSELKKMNKELQSRK
jgi:hypothetical protein